MKTNVDEKKRELEGSVRSWDEESGAGETPRREPVGLRVRSGIKSGAGDLQDWWR